MRSKIRIDSTPRASLSFDAGREPLRGMEGTADEGHFSNNTRLHSVRKRKGRLGNYFMTPSWRPKQWLVTLVSSTIESSRSSVSGQQHGLRTMLRLRAVQYASVHRNCLTPNSAPSPQTRGGRCCNRHFLSSTVDNQFSIVKGRLSSTKEEVRAYL